MSAVSPTEWEFTMALSHGKLALRRIPSGKLGHQRFGALLNRSHDKASQRLSSTTSTIVLTPQHGSFHINYLPSSIYRKKWPGCNKSRVPIIKVRSSSCYAYRLGSEHGAGTIDHVLHRFTSLMMIPFSMCFISIDYLF